MRPIVLVAALSMSVPLGAAELKRETLTAWNRYVALTEARIERELGAQNGFLVQDFLPEDDREAVKRELAEGRVFATKLRTVDARGEDIDVPGGMVHHWVGSVFVPGVEVEDLLAFLQDYDEHHRYFDEVEESRLVSRHGDRFEIFLRLRRTKIVTVHYATEHSVRYRRHEGGNASSASRTTRIAELEGANTPDEKEKPVGDDRGFLWRLNSYWRFAAAPGGVLVECESLSLSRGVPMGLRFLVAGYLDSVPRESLQATLGPIRASGPALTGGEPPSCSSGASSRRCDTPPDLRRAEGGARRRP